jgi:hypothetical protein
MKPITLAAALLSLSIPASILAYGKGNLPIVTSVTNQLAPNNNLKLNVNVTVTPKDGKFYLNKTQVTRPLLSPDSFLATTTTSYEYKSPPQFPAATNTINYQLSWGAGQRCNVQLNVSIKPASNYIAVIPNSTHIDNNDCSINRSTSHPTHFTITVHEND